MAATHVQTEKKVSGIAASLFRLRIEKLRRQLGNGHDVELRTEIGQLLSKLGQRQQALHAYKAAVTVLTAIEHPLDTACSEQLIEICKQILALSPSDNEIVELLGEEYRRRGMDYRAINLYTRAGDRYAQQGEYQKAISYYHQILGIEPGSISARQTCAYLYCHLRKYTQGAEEYLHIGNIYYEHEKFDGALGYYQKAEALDPENADIQYRLLLTRQIIERTVTPRSQQRLQLLNHVDTVAGSFEDKECIVQELRQKICQLQKQYQRSGRMKQSQLRMARRQLHTLAAHVNSLEEYLKTVKQAREQLQEQLALETERKQDLQHKLMALNDLQVAPIVMNDHTVPSQQQQCVTSTAKRLAAQKAPLVQRLHGHLAQISQREQDLRAQLDQYARKGTTLTRRLEHIDVQRHRLKQRVRKNLAKNQRHEKMLQKQFQKLLRQHKYILQQIVQEKQASEQTRCPTANRTAQQKTAVIPQKIQECGNGYHRYEIEELQTSLENIALLLNTQDQDIRQLAEVS